MGSGMDCEGRPFPSPENTYLSLTEDPIALSPKTHLKEGRRYRYDLAPGTAKLNTGGLNPKNARAIAFTCPCSCGGVWVVGLNQNNWNQDEKSPTIHHVLKPQLPCQWTGLLQNGVFQRHVTAEPGPETGNRHTA